MHKIIFKSFFFFSFSWVVNRKQATWDTQLFFDGYLKCLLQYCFFFSTQIFFHTGNKELTLSMALSLPQLAIMESWGLSISLAQTQEHSISRRAWEKKYCKFRGPSHTCSSLRIKTFLDIPDYSIGIEHLKDLLFTLTFPSRTSVSFRQRNHVFMDLIFHMAIMSYHLCLFSSHTSARPKDIKRMYI